MENEDYGKNLALNYLFHLRTECDKMIDTVFMKNNKKEIFKYLNNIDNNSDK